MLAIKAVIYRALRIVLLLIVAFLISGDVGMATKISIADSIIATIYYYYFDIVWEKFDEYIKNNKCK